MHKNLHQWPDLIREIACPTTPFGKEEAKAIVMHRWKATSDVKPDNFPELPGARNAMRRCNLRTVLPDGSHCVPGPKERLKKLVSDQANSLQGRSRAAPPDPDLPAPKGLRIRA